MTETVTRESQQMSEFGRTLYSMMLMRGIEHRQDLLKAVNDAGYTISQPRLSYYLNGQRNVDWKFVACVADLLKLNKKERQELAWVFAYGQG